MRRFRWGWSVLTLATALLVIACDGRDDASPTASPTASPSVTATATATTTAVATPAASPITSLRDVDFTAPAIVGPLIDRAGGGEVDPERVRFAQLIAGGPEEAVVIVDSGGTAGEIGAGVYRLDAGEPVLEHFFSYQGRLDINRELIVTREGVYRPGDADCCPSQLREVTYQWDGSEFVVTTDQVVPNPAE